MACRSLVYRAAPIQPGENRFAVVSKYIERHLTHDERKRSHCISLLINAVYQRHNGLIATNHQGDLRGFRLWHKPGRYQTYAITETIPPVASITSPLASSTISGLASLVSVVASDTIGVTKVAFYIDGALYATQTSTPYVFNINTAQLSSGTHTLYAQAYDAAGNVGTSPSVQVTVAPPLDAYSDERAITVASDPSIVSSTLADFPMLFSRTYPWLAATEFGGDVQNANGYDIIFASDSACSNKLNFETEYYASTTGELEDWVQVPSLTAGTVIYLCYNNGAVGTDQENAAATWDSNYDFVYHFPNGTVLSTKDYRQIIWLRP